MHSAEQNTSHIRWTHRTVGFRPFTCFFFHIKMKGIMSLRRQSCHFTDDMKMVNCRENMVVGKVYVNPMQVLC